MVVLNDENIFESIKKEYLKYNVYDILKRISYLSCLFQNQDKNYYFNHLINLCLSLDINSTHNNPIISDGEFKRITRKIENTSVNSQIDPFENVYIEKIIHINEYYTFNGINIMATYNLNNLLLSIFMTKNNLPKEYKNKISWLVHMFLNLQNEIIESCDFRNGNFNYEFSRKIYFPKENYFYQAVEFDIRILYRNMEPHKEYLNKYIFDKDKYNEFKNTDDNNFFHFKYPFYKSGDKLIILDATILNSLLANEIIELSKEFKVTKELNEIFNNINWIKIKHYVDTVHDNDLSFLVRTLELKEEKNIKEKVNYISSDKVLVTIAIFNDLCNYNCGNMFSNYKFNDKELNNRIKYYNNYFQKRNIDAFFLIVSCSVNNSYSYSIYLPINDGVILLNPFQLKMVSINEKSNSNFLVKYCESKKNNKIMKNNDTDMSFISFFSTNDYSFYINDDFDNKTTTLNIGWDYIFDYVNKNYDIEYRKVSAYPFDDKIYILQKMDDNIYFVKANLKGEFRHLIYVGEVKVWVVLSISKDDEKFYSEIKSMIEAITYWINELNSTIVSSNFNEIVYIIKFTNLTKESETMQIDVYNNVAHVFFDYTYSKNMTVDSFNNEYEKYIVSKLIFTFFSVDSKEFDLIFEPKTKSKFTTINATNKLFLLPCDKKIISANLCDENMILDEIGEYTRTVLRIGIGNGIAHDEINRIVDDCILFKMEELIKKFDYKYLLTLAYEELENAVSKLFVMKRNAGSRLQLYQKHEHKINESFIALNNSSTALRFIVEYVSATQIEGSIKASRYDLEKIMAYVLKIITFAEYSNYICYNLIDVKPRLLKSGRIGIDRKKVEDYTNTFVCQISKSLLIDSKYKDFMINGINYFDVINNCFFDDYCYKLEDLYGVIDCLNKISNHESQKLNKFKYDFIIDKASTETKLDKKIVKKVIDDLSLIKREKFSEVKKYGVKEIVPWKYNRLLSLYRKPLIQCGDSLIWGIRALNYSKEYLMQLIYSGRMRTGIKNSKLESLNGNILGLLGSDFNDFVFDMLNKDARLKCYKNINVMNSKKIESNTNEPLGDIDVLCIDENNQKVFLIECKNFKLAHNADELRNDIDEMFRTTKEKPLIVKQRNRYNWVVNHYDDMIKEFKLDKLKHWEIISLFVINEPIILSVEEAKNENIIDSENLSYETINAL